MVLMAVSFYFVSDNITAKMESDKVALFLHIVAPYPVVTIYMPFGIHITSANLFSFYIIWKCIKKFYNFSLLEQNLCTPVCMELCPKIC